MLENIIHFFQGNGYIFECIITTITFTLFYKRRNLFVLRFLLGFGVMLAFSILWDHFVMDRSVSHTLLKYGIYFILLMGIVTFAWKTTFWSMLYAVVGQTVTQHFAFCIDTCILSGTGIKSDMWESGVIDFFVFMGVCVVVAVCFSKQLKDAEEKTFRNFRNLILAAFVLMFVIVLHAIEEPFNIMYVNPKQFMISSGYRMICCLIALFLQYDLFKSTKISNNNAVLEKVVQMQKEQYQFSVENINLINHKCHDMKHQIKLVENQIGSPVLEELSSLIQVYDDTVKSGNELLDVFLTQKKMYCDNHDIRFDCILDGKGLDFMEPTDMYTLFGNAIDNAIEAVMKVKDENKRIIELVVRRELNMVSIHFENYYEGELELVNEIPTTTKLNTSQHGFGIKSIMMIVDHYKGNTTLTYKDNVFNLNILIPIS